MANQRFIVVQARPPGTVSSKNAKWRTPHFVPVGAVLSNLATWGRTGLFVHFKVAFTLRVKAAECGLALEMLPNVSPAAERGRVARRSQLDGLVIGMRKDSLACASGWYGGTVEEGAPGGRSKQPKG